MSGVGLNLSLGANIIEDCIRDVLEPLSNGFVSSGCFAMRNVTRCYAKKTFSIRSDDIIYYFVYHQFKVISFDESIVPSYYIIHIEHINQMRYEIGLSPHRFVQPFIFNSDCVFGMLIFGGNQNRIKHALFILL